MPPLLALTELMGPRDQTEQTVTMVLRDLTALTESMETALIRLRLITDFQAARQLG